jgi:hypothetical protein
MGAMTHPAPASAAQKDDVRMTARPILFSSAMIRVILAGRKTQTRRVVKLGHPGTFGRSDTPGYDWTFRGTRRGGLTGAGSSCWQDLRHPQLLDLCPFGTIGDRLWVRETWCGEINRNTAKLIYDEDGNTYQVLYRADGHHVVKDDGDGFATYNQDSAEASPWKPSIHMPRWASRITLEITGIRCERLGEISGWDAKAEGVDDCEEAGHDDCYYGASGQGWRCSFERLWDSINDKPGKRWADSPWVWAIDFRTIAAADTEPR